MKEGNNDKDSLFDFKLDNRLLKKLKKDPELFALVYQRHQDYVYKYLLGRCRDVDVAEDLTADTFEAAYRALGSFRSRSTIRTWLISIARNKYADYIRKRGTERFNPAQAENLVSGHSFPNEDLIALSDLLDRLPGENQEILKLRILAGLSHEEIGHLLSRKSATVRTLYNRGLETLMRYLNNEGRGTYEIGG